MNDHVYISSVYTHSLPEEYRHETLRENLATFQAKNSKWSHRIFDISQLSFLSPKRMIRDKHDWK